MQVLLCQNNSGMEVPNRRCLVDRLILTKLYVNDRICYSDIINEGTTSVARVHGLAVDIQMYQCVRCESVELSADVC